MQNTDEAEANERLIADALEQAALRLQVSRAALKRRWRAMDLLNVGW